MVSLPKKPKIDTPGRKKWLDSLNEQEYKEFNKLVNRIKDSCVETVLKESNHDLFTDSSSDEEMPSVLDDEVKQAYEAWKKKHAQKLAPKAFPKVNVIKLLILLNLLKQDKTKTMEQESQDQLKHCLSQSRSNHGNRVWALPSQISLAIRQCILTRNWSRMTQLLIVLLQQFSNPFRYYVRNMCKIMMKVNPLIKECNLMDQFETVTKTVIPELLRPKTSAEDIKD